MLVATLPTLACALAVQPVRLPVHAARARAPLLLFGGTKLPAEVAATLDPGVPTKDVEPLWRELRKCYPTERAAIDAACKQPLVLLPFINRAENIKFCFQVLREIGFDDAERLEVITRNPGILANKPYDLSLSSMDDVRRSISAMEAIDRIPEPIRLAIPTVTVLLIVGVIAKRLSDCAGGICG